MPNDWSIDFDDEQVARLRLERDLDNRIASPDYSIELPRHIPLDDFHDWSYHSQVPQQHDTVSTAAHHASALTLSAGLARRRDFDQSRIVDDMINIPPDLSAFNITRTPKAHSRIKTVNPLSPIQLLKHAHFITGRRTADY